jgi:hypothetical protein
MCAEAEEEVELQACYAIFTAVQQSVIWQTVYQQQP